MKKQKLSICMISKDEEKFIGKSLESAKEIADELIVVDTGSKDKTKNIAAELGAKVFDLEWKDDFSLAHNYAISKATGDWILVLDADEMISTKDHKRLLKLLEEEKVDGYILEQRTYSKNIEAHNWSICEGDYEEENGFAGYFSAKLTRLFRNNKDYHFTNRNHDIVEPSIKEKGGKIMDSSIPIHHYAKAKSNEFFSLKMEQYLYMGLSQIKEDPSNPRPYYEVGLIYMAKDDLKSAEKNFKKVVELNESYKTANTQLGIIELKRKNLRKAAEIFQESIKRQPKQDLVYLYLGDLMMMINKFQKAANIYKEAALLNPKNFVAHQKYCTAMVQYGKPDIALAVLLKILNKNKSIIDVYNSIGEIYFAKKNYEKAKQVLQKGIKVADEQENDAKKMMLMINLADAYKNLGKKDEAITLLNETLAMKPKDAEMIRERIKNLR